MELGAIAISNFITQTAGPVERLTIPGNIFSGLFASVFLPDFAIMQHIQAMYPDIHAHMKTIVDMIIAIPDAEVRRTLLVSDSVRIVRRDTP